MNILPRERARWIVPPQLQNGISGDIGVNVQVNEHRMRLLPGDTLELTAPNARSVEFANLRPHPLDDEIVVECAALGLRPTRLGTSVRANGKGIIKYALGHIAPSVFGSPFHFEATLRDEHGRVKKRRRVWNTVTTAGKNGIADLILAAPTLGKPTHMAVGTGTPSGTALGVENDRNAFTSKTRANAVVTMVGNWAAGDATAALTESGTFDASSSGNMWMSTSFAVINKGSLDTLQITWTLTIS